jgi:hypothetical protein
MKKLSGAVIIGRRADEISFAVPEFRALQRYCGLDLKIQRPIYVNFSQKSEGVLVNVVSGQTSQEDFRKDIAQRLYAAAVNARTQRENPPWGHEINLHPASLLSDSSPLNLPIFRVLETYDSLDAEKRYSHLAIDLVTRSADYRIKHGEDPQKVRVWRDYVFDLLRESPLGF